MRNCCHKPERRRRRGGRQLAALFAMSVGSYAHIVSSECWLFAKHPVEKRACWQAEAVLFASRYTEGMEVVSGRLIAMGKTDCPSHIFLVHLQTP
jgi:hypothetical protein